MTEWNLTQKQLRGILSDMFYEPGVAPRVVASGTNGHVCILSIEYVPRGLRAYPWPKQRRDVLRYMSDSLVVPRHNPSARSFVFAILEWRDRCLEDVRENYGAPMCDIMTAKRESDKRIRERAVA